MTSGCIDVVYDAGHALYTATCHCGLTWPTQQAIELSELELLAHMDRHHREQAAA